MKTAPQYQRLTEAIPKILAASTKQKLWRSLGRAAKDTIGAERTAVFLIDHIENRVLRPFTSGFSEQFIQNTRTRIADLPAAQLMQQEKPVIVHDLSRSQETHSLSTVSLIADGVHAIAVFPLIVDDEIKGVFALYGNQPNTFTADCIQIGQTLAQIGAAALKNLDLLADAAKSLRREKRRNEMSFALSNSFDQPAILLSVVKMATELIEADAGLLGLVIDDQMMTFYPHNIPTSISLRPAARKRGIAWHIVDTKKSVRLDNYLQHPDAQAKWETVGIKAFLGVPVISGQECLGALTLFNTETQRKFTGRDLELAESIGRQAAVAIQHARMFAEAKQRATALANALTRQEELDQLKNQFIHSMSHELRTPLGIIYGHAELLESEALGALAPAQKESIQIIGRRVHMLTDLVDDLTALLAAETQEFRREQIDPQQLIYSVLSEYRIQAEEKEITLHADIADALPGLRGDHTHLRRVFDNLFSNAFKFTPAGGTVTLRVFAKQDQIILTISDTGEGIEPEQLPRIFERFYQVKGKNNAPLRKGTGLGLALVKEIVEAHRGTISVESTVGEGTTFRIALPTYTPSEDP